MECAEGASENFRVCCRTAAYDVIFFKFQRGGGQVPPSLAPRASCCYTVNSEYTFTPQAAVLGGGGGQLPMGARRIFLSAGREPTRLTSFRHVESAREQFYYFFFLIFGLKFECYLMLIYCQIPAGAHKRF